MKIDFSQQLKQIDGELMTVKESDPITGITNDTGEPFDLKHVATQAMLGQLQGEKLDGAKSYKRFKLIERIRDDGPEVECTAEEIADLKRRIGEFFLANVVGQAWDMLDPPGEGGKKKGGKK